MLSYTFPLSEANKEAFWEEKGMQFPQYASPVANNHKSSCNPRPWRWMAEGLCCHWCIHQSRVRHLCTWCLSSEGPPHSFGLTWKDVVRAARAALLICRCSIYSTDYVENDVNCKKPPSNHEVRNTCRHFSLK